ncbi:MAG: sn-glycerol-3-phosphate ABC transporter ATP-binding protein UgpC [Elusimicrobia bacterium]|nr:sn-glycerol-3-phosphate ABC transporter ATP-binding protein UgpC [Elusimicrobiota bacterium]
MASVTLSRITKVYHEHPVLDDISLEVAEGEFMILVGPSGCGKSTLLRMVAGLEEITDGEIRIGGQVVNHLPPRDREIAMVVQDYALYPHMTVAENMSFGLRLRRLPKDEIARRVDEAAGILQIQSLLGRTPRQLSGGQRQRVAIGRAIVRKPKVFLFDEPLSNLDAKLREEMRVEIAKLHQSLGATILYVTHDQVEAMTLGSRLAVMNGGLIQQAGAPAEVFSRPANHFVAGFIGSPTMNFIPGAAAGGGFQSPDLSFKLDGRNSVSGPVVLGVRPEGISVDKAAGEGWSEPVPAVIEVVELLGYKRNLYLKAGDQRLLAVADASFGGKPGDTVSMRFQLDGIHLFDKETKKRL